jgi:HSP20 family protein
MTMLLEPFGSLFDAPRQRQLRADRSRAFLPAADLVASEDEVTLVMDVPGFKTRGSRDRAERRDVANPRRASLSLRLRAGRPQHPPPRTRLRRFERVLQVPKDVDPSTLTASIEDGVLTLRIPVPEARKPHRIEIRSGETQRVIDAEWSTEGGHKAPARAMGTEAIASSPAPAPDPPKADRHRNRKAIDTGRSEARPSRATESPEAAYPRRGRAPHPPR